ncbi:hypothetical protein HQ865_22705 [Mucilaginibacter mali]|uniref:Lipocalin-like domain-containing protein n=1 Tax=Mucilaginibacter mali TaxID=2740462 RepID=A0A7D4TQ81_9SPHI|nr:hypothetical protein [Mucilaginibacter mali]QKJ32453.1 hypothetical protein HQ865_22705 [Mucilaginibacter mali]
MHYERTLQIPPKPRRGLWKVALLLAALSIGACKKDGDGSKAKLLTSGKWTLRKTEQRQKDGTWIEVAHYDPTTLEFRDDGTVTMIVGSASGVRGWRLSGDQSQLTFVSASGGGDTYDIAQLTSSVLQYSPTGYAPDDYAHRRDTYTH